MSSPSHDITVARRTDAAHQRVRHLMDQDGLDRADASHFAHIEFVSARGKPCPHFLRQAVGCLKLSFDRLRVA